MDWFNIYGFIFLIIIMIPNILCAILSKESFENKWKNKAVEILEQIGRFSSFGFFIINIPGTYFGFWSNKAFILYIVIDSILILAYEIIWIICFRKNNLFRAYSLSIIPSIIFLFSGIISRSILLILSSLIFAPSHILISVKNAKS